MTNSERENEVGEMEERKGKEGGIEGKVERRRGESRTEDKEHKDKERKKKDRR